MLEDDIIEQDRKNLAQVISVETCNNATYENGDSDELHMFLRNEKGYKVRIKGDSHVNIFIFDKDNKYISHIKYKAV